MIADWFSAFVFTQALEVPIYFVALGRRADPRGVAAGPEGQKVESRRWRLGFAFLASMATHPYVWFVIPSLFYGGAWERVTYAWPALEAWRYFTYFMVAESFAVLAEAALLHALRVPRALLWALVGNATSALTGLALRASIGWP